MVRKEREIRYYIENVINLDSVITSTNGPNIITEIYHIKTIFVEISENTGAVTVNIEASPDGSIWYELNSTTYSSINTKDVRGYVDYFPYMRTTTTNHSNATVKTIFVGRS